jgi:hypothetical protein
LEFGRVRTRIALSYVTFFLTLMITAVELLSTHLAARIGVLCAVNDVRVFTTMTSRHLFLLARLACSWMAISLTFMLVAVQSFLTLLSALVNEPIFTASDHSLTLSTLAFDDSTLVLAGRTLASVAH